MSTSVPRFRLRRIFVRLMAVAAIALFSIGLSGATQQASAATGVAISQHGNAASPAVLGVCTVDPPSVIIYTFQQGSISQCGTCLSIGQLGEDEDFWENFVCWNSGADWQLWVESGVH